jgi:Histidine kinase
MVLDQVRSGQIGSDRIGSRFPGAAGYDQAPRARHPNPEEAHHALAAIETTGWEALTEMRRLLGVLREEGQPRAALSPAPGLADLPLLLIQFREAGLDVTMTATGSPIKVRHAVEQPGRRRARLDRDEGNDDQALVRGGCPDGHPDAHHRRAESHPTGPGRP